MRALPNAKYRRACISKRLIYNNVTITHNYTSSTLTIHSFLSLITLTLGKHVLSSASLMNDVMLRNHIDSISSHVIYNMLDKVLTALRVKR
jgi:hypothetical protein